MRDLQLDLDIQGVAPEQRLARLECILLHFGSLWSLQLKCLDLLNCSLLAEAAVELRSLELGDLTYFAENDVLTMQLSELQPLFLLTNLRRFDLTEPHWEGDSSVDVLHHLSSLSRLTGHWLNCYWNPDFLTPALSFHSSISALQELEVSEVFPSTELPNSFSSLSKADELLWTSM